MCNGMNSPWIYACYLPEFNKISKTQFNFFFGDVELSICQGYSCVIFSGPSQQNELKETTPAEKSGEPSVTS
jgi:hypothetical protein